jgi:tRNA(Ile)-lysidine synthase
MVKKVLDTIRKHNLIKNGDILVVGVSGGPDSICLLHVLFKLSEELKINIAAAHINHMLRGEESDSDQKYVESICDKLRIKLFAKAFDVEQIAIQRRISLEEAGRDCRYLYFSEVAELSGASKIAIAHNRNDQAETVLMHIIRGTGLDGLRGMEYVRENVIRPLLDVPREDIEKYCEDNLLFPRTDSSNLKDVYTRNKIRLGLIPYINDAFSTNITESIFKMAALIKDDHNFIEQSASKLYNQCVLKREAKRISLDITKLSGFHKAMVKRIIRIALDELKGSLKGIESVHVKDICDLAYCGRTGAQLHLPDNVIVERSYDVLSFFYGEEISKASGFNKLIGIPGSTIVEDNNTILTASVFVNIISLEAVQINQKSLTQLFDYEKLKVGINIRSRNNGDVFNPYKSPGTKKLKEYFIDNKIPRDKRDEIPLVAKNNEIVWIIGYKISDKFKVTENTKSILKLEYKHI